MAERRPDRTLGPQHDSFWNWCAKGELRLQRCDACDTLVWPVVQKCATCGGQSFTWQRLSGHGKVVSWTTFDQDYYRGLMDVPYDTILVELAEGPLFISNSVGFGWRDLRADMPVKVTFVPAEDSAGSFSLPVFERSSVEQEQGMEDGQL